MDPVMRAAQAFVAEVDRFLRRFPGRVLPLVAEPSARGEMAKALRLAELAPANRRALFLYEARFGDAGKYLGAALLRRRLSIVISTRCAGRPKAKERPPGPADRGRTHRTALIW